MSREREIVLNFYRPSLRGKSGIYQIRNLVNDKLYIGSTDDFHNRSYKHWWELTNQITDHHSSHLQRAFNKYGEENFIFEIIELVPRLVNESIEDFKHRLINIREQAWIDLYLSWDRDFGYNINKVANSRLGIKASFETIEKMKNKKPKLESIIGFSTTVYVYNLDGEFQGSFYSIAETERQLGVGGVHEALNKNKKRGDYMYTDKKYEYIAPYDPTLNFKNPELRNKRISEAKFGYTFTDEHREKLSQAHLGKIRSRESIQKAIDTKKNNGYRHPPEILAKISKNKLRPILQYDLDGNFIKEWSGATVAADFYNITHCCILDAMRGNRQQTAAGFQWRKKINNNYPKNIGVPNLKETGRPSIPIVQLDIDGNFIAEYSSIADGTRTLGINNGSSNITSCISGKLKKAYGFKWMKSEDYYKKLNKVA